MISIARNPKWIPILDSVGTARQQQQ